ncbi:5-carboxymethyl-2-hydroxymuconate semialdehyde dehydrogenase [Salmonella enterica subsp. enterica]|uniref:5-carboxymethyl-2-hydroxymuconate semialdehyde dehydrogenase n=1 Tax=Salmonella enterica I TaxID=59201 RepID=A0A379UNZ2_SALET|nr:5-carboxymethyl-2-hydroxymuconate semialdehyde dehydrogenase [Salmonella enterica subsp. enterica]
MCRKSRRWKPPTPACLFTRLKNVLIPRASHNFEFFAEVCQQMNGKTYPVDDKMLNYTLVQPVGVCALVSPWNVPFMTATWKVAPCLALGNTAVLKMSELSPLTADRLGELAAGGRNSGRRAERGAGLRRDGGRCAGTPP